jgi:hypothetical protein
MKNMKNFKITTEYSGGDIISLYDDSGISKSITIGGTIDDLCRDIKWTILKQIGYDHIPHLVHVIEKDMQCLGYDVGILADRWYTVNEDAEWMLFDVICSAKTHNTKRLLKLLESADSLQRHMPVVMSLCALYRLTPFVSHVMMNRIFGHNNISDFVDIFDKTYTASSISDNINTFDTLRLFDIPIKDIDRLLVTAVEHNSQCIVNALLYTHEVSKNALDEALEIAEKKCYRNICSNLTSHGAGTSKAIKE